MRSLLELQTAPTNVQTRCSSRLYPLITNIFKMRELYPPIEPYHEGKLQVSDIHTIHFEESGNSQGKPIVLLHGGPGGGCPPHY